MMHSKMRSTLLSRLALPLVLLACLTPKPSSAGTCGTGLDPILLVVTPIVFASYDATLTLDLTVNGTVTVSCTLVVVDTLPSFTVALSAGTGGSGFSPRQMSFGGNRLNYNLYTSPSYATVWGDGTNSTVTMPYSASSGQSLELMTIYGKITKNQYVPAGLYLDSITVTVTY